MLGEGTDQSTKNLTKEIARSLTAEAQKLFTIDKNQATGEIAKNINSKMSWLQDVFVNEKDLANNIVDMAQTSIDGYMNTERINAMVIAMIYNIMERMHSDLQAK